MKSSIFEQADCADIFTFRGRPSAILGEPAQTRNLRCPKKIDSHMEVGARGRTSLVWHLCKPQTFLALCFSGSWRQHAVAFGLRRVYARLLRFTQRTWGSRRICTPLRVKSYALCLLWIFLYTYGTFWVFTMTCPIYVAASLRNTQFFNHTPVRCEWAKASASIVYCHTSVFAGNVW